MEGDVGRRNRRNVRMIPRRLFLQDEEGADVENLSNIVEEFNKKSAQTAKERWNFDFATETPLEGDWEWERVAPTSSTPTPPTARTQEQEATRPQLMKNENERKNDSKFNA